MRIYVYPADLHGCGFLRLIWVSRVLAAEGHQITIVMPGDRLTAHYMPQGTVQNGRTIAATAPADADVMVMQRVTHRRLAEAIPLYRAKGIAVVVDMDDDLSCIHPSNPAWKALHPRSDGQFGWDVAHDACRDATLVTVSTDALAERYAAHGRVAVLRNCIPARYLNIAHQDSDRVGWAGAVASHPDDLAVMGSAAAQLIRDGGKFHVVGPPEGVARCLGLDGGWTASGGVPMQRWPYQIAGDLGVGVAPLADTRFNEAKSWLKPLEYAALGVPSIVSPRREYTRLSQLGIGLLAKRPRDWSRLMRELSRDPARRAELSEQVRESARSLTIEGNAWRWLEAWSLALKIQRAGITVSAS